MLGVSDGENGFVGLRDTDKLAGAARPLILRRRKPKRQRPDHQVIVIQPCLQADIAGRIGGEQIADVLSGGVCDGFEVHETTIDAARLLTNQSPFTSFPSASRLVPVPGFCAQLARRKPAL
jgi:hypothetical protein